MARRRRRNQGSAEVPFGEWIPTHAVRFNDNGSVSLMTEGPTANPGRSAGAGYGTWSEARYGSGAVEYERAKHAREATRKKGAKVTALQKGYSGWGFKYAYPLDPPQYSLFNRGRREKDEYQLEHERLLGRWADVRSRISAMERAGEMVPDSMWDELDELEAKGYGR